MKYQFVSYGTKKMAANKSGGKNAYRSILRAIHGLLFLHLKSPMFWELPEAYN